jgi:hypothetical protein
MPAAKNVVLNYHTGNICVLQDVYASIQLESGSLYCTVQSRIYCFAVTDGVHVDEYMEEMVQFTDCLLTSKRYLM